MGKNRRSKEFKNNSQVIDMEAARKERLAKRRAERAKQEKKAKQEAQKNTRGKMAIRRQRNRRRLGIALLAIIIIAIVGVCVFKIVSLKNEQKEALAQQEELKAQKQELQEELDSASDKENIEEQARSQLRLVKPGEVLYTFAEEVVNQVENSDEGQDTDED
jgi:cell division protein FtsB